MGENAINQKKGTKQKKGEKVHKKKSKDGSKQMICMMHVCMMGKGPCKGNARGLPRRHTRYARAPHRRCAEDAVGRTLVATKIKR